MQEVQRLQLYLARKTVILLGIFLVILIIVIVSVVLQQGAKKQQQVSPATSGFTVPMLSPAPTGNLFFADLEYNPETKAITQLRTGITNDQSKTSPSKPLATTSGQFIYKVVVHSQDNKLLEQYWQAIPEKIIKTATNNFKFRVIAVYEPNATVRLSLIDNRLIWTGVIR